MDSSNPTSDNGRSLRDILDEHCIETDLEPGEKPTVLQRLLELLAHSGKIDDVDAALHALLEREKQSSTAIGRGVAVPHAEVGGISRPLLALGVSQSPLGFDALDREPVHMVFLLLFPRGGTGLRMRLVGQVMRLMRKSDVRDALRHASSAKEAKQRLLEFLPPGSPGNSSTPLPSD